MTDSMSSQELMHSIIQRIATGPELSKDISLDEASGGVSAILRGEIDDVQAAIFLIALRMKRETDDENKGALDAILKVSESRQANVDELISLADPYSGVNRNLPIAPLIPPVLAACGLPCVSHGLNSVGPKFGITHRHVLQAAGIDVDMSLDTAISRVEDPELGWAYVDQRTFCPGLHNLTGLRQQIIKRQVLTTVEVLAKPITGRIKTHLVTGYVHKPYPAKYASLARFAGFEGCLLVRGTEGGVIPSLRQSGMIYRYQDMGQEEAIDISPDALGIEQPLRAVPLPDDTTINTNGDEIARIGNVSGVAMAAAETGLRALQGEKGPAYDSLLYSCALILWHAGRFHSVTVAADQVRQVLDSGAVHHRMR
ncbi:MAG: anthranilate phosphoribosyltransferase [Candidatus Thiodiazotropha sp. (ex Lucinoma borealis)]|nr:anthranilate phosphoribosyltransferase [Candidatus Thiodiazotropha sp. (ex Lucinoma borealis)]MCU7868064.1 anthranilate phosphoribosyltransferase [Candidatus Thiodiazotropha sp. (ex Lucinoma borealis)]